MTEERRFCRDCRHAFKQVERGTMKAVLHCFSERNRDLVTGEIDPVSCWSMRYELKGCGLTGELWEPTAGSAEGRRMGAQE